MTVETLGNIGDFVGGVGVLVTLLYLASQVRQNTQSLDAKSRQDVADRLVGVNRLLIDPRVARACAVGFSSYPDTPFEERNSFSILMGEQVTIFHSALALYESGILPEETYVAQLDWVASLLNTPGGARWWAAWGPPQPGNVFRVINERLALGGLLDPREFDNYRLDDPPAAQQSAAADSA